MSKKILILGGSGLLGQTLSEFLTLKKYQITAASRNPNLENSQIHTHKVDILDAEKLEQLIEGFDIVINCTGQISNPIYNCYLQNTQGTKNIIDAVKKHGVKLIHVSSVSVYGSAEFVDEKSDLNPETTYGSMKCFADYQIENSLDDYTILRVSNLYGDHQKKGIINYLTKSYQQKEHKLYFNNNGDLSRYYLNVKDLSAIIYNIIEQNNITGSFNVIGDRQYTIKELVEFFENVLNYKYEVEYTQSLPYDNISQISDEKLNSKISVQYSSLEEYIRSLV